MADVTPPLSAAELLAKLRGGTKLIHDVKMRDAIVSMRVLSMAEVNWIRRTALAECKQKGLDETDKNVIIQKLTLSKASQLEPNGPSYLSEKLLEMATVDEVNYLYNEYVRVMDTVNPSVATMSNDAFRQIVDDLKKNTLSPSDLSLPQLRMVCTTFVELIRELESQKQPKAK